MYFFFFWKVQLSIEEATKLVTSRPVPSPTTALLCSEMCVSIHCDKILGKKKNLEEEDFLWPVYQRVLSMVIYCFWACYKARASWCKGMARRHPAHVVQGRGRDNLHIRSKAWHREPARVVRGRVMETPCTGGARAWWR